MTNLKKFIAFNERILKIAQEYEWNPGVRYTNLRDIKKIEFEGKGFLDIKWKNYDFVKHLDAVSKKKPLITVARDIEDISSLDETLKEAEILNQFSKYVIIVPKDLRFGSNIDKLIPSKFLIGYSVPSKYGGTKICSSYFNRPVHLLGGRPDVQRSLGKIMNVVSLDCNRFTIDAKFGDYFDGHKFSKHPNGGYFECIKDSLKNINLIWKDYTATSSFWE